MLQSIGHGVYSFQSNRTSPNIFATDLDWTLIRPVRGRFPKDASDWAWLPNRISTLKAYQEAGYLIVIFSNQGVKGKKLTMALDRINNVIDDLNRNGIHPWVFVATQDNEYRKPNPGMWSLLTNSISVEQALYTGDAGGRPGDFSDSDRKFAENTGLSFYVPEEIFPRNEIMIPDTQTMFIFVGMQGSGKSTFFDTYLAPRHWVHVNQDILKTQPKVLQAIETALKQGQSVAVDATTPTPDKRRNYLELAVKYQVPVMIIYFVRNGYEWNKSRQHPVPDIGYNIYFKNLVEPSFEVDGVPVVEYF
jgi:bifunctional polynucleotide phosphatase/kinase